MVKPTGHNTISLYEHLGQS